MNTATAPIEQQARIRETSGNVQLVRDGFFLPAQAGMALLPGDRLVTDLAAKVVVQFTGVNDALIVERGAGATFNLEVVEMEQAPQWIATNIQGEGVYFDSQELLDDTTPAQADANGGLFGLFGTPGAKESTGYPILESIVFLGATAAIYSDNENNTTTPATTSTTESGNTTGTATGTGAGGSTTTPPPATTPGTEPEAGPLDAVLAPISNVLDGLAGSLTDNLGASSSPMGSQTIPLENNNLLNTLNLTNLA